MLPLLRAHPFVFSEPLARAIRPGYVYCLGLAMYMPVMFIDLMFIQQPRYPISYQDLPQGVGVFLNRVSPGGTVLNHPDNGGYLRWLISPKHKVFMDMEVPFPFTAEDLQVAHNMFADRAVLQNVIDQYHPSFLTVPFQFEKFPDLIESFPDYRRVFFDDAEVLYVDAR